jgi:hypothetical protein
VRLVRRDDHTAGRYRARWANHHVALLSQVLQEWLQRGKRNPEAFGQVMSVDTSQPAELRTQLLDDGSVVEERGHPLLVVPIFTSHSYTPTV